MNDLFSVVDWSRAQFALTAMYHWLFVPLTLGLGVIVGIMETIYYRSGDERWKQMTKFCHWRCNRYYFGVSVRNELV